MADEKAITQEHIPSIKAPSDLQTARTLFEDACKLHTQDRNDITWKAVEVARAEVLRIEEETREAHLRLLIVVCERQEKRGT